MTVLAMADTLRRFMIRGDKKDRKQTPAFCRLVLSLWLWLSFVLRVRVGVRVRVRVRIRVVKREIIVNDRQVHAKHFIKYRVQVKTQTRALAKQVSKTSTKTYTPKTKTKNILQRL